MALVVAVILNSVPLCLVFVPLVTVFKENIIQLAFFECADVRLDVLKDMLPSYC